MKAQNYTYCTAFGDDMATVTGKSAARGRDSVYNLRRVLEQANDRISKSRRARKYLLRTLRKEQDENARLKLEIERLKEVSEMWQTIATSSVTAGGELLDALENE